MKKVLFVFGIWSEAIILAPVINAFISNTSNYYNNCLFVNGSNPRVKVFNMKITYDYGL